MRVSCRQHRPVDVLPSFLLCPEDALDVLSAIEATNPDARHIALVTDPDRRGRLAIPFPTETPLSAEEAADGGGIERIADLLLEAAGEDPWDVPCVVLCTCRGGAGSVETDDDVATWARLRDRCREHGFVELLDWFLLGDEEARSMSELYGPGWGWPDDDAF
jgi:hypothetical protein